MENFDEKCLANILGFEKDHTFAKQILPELDTKDFTSSYAKMVFQLLSEYWQKYKDVPNYATLNNIAKAKKEWGDKKTLVLEYIKELESIDDKDSQWFQDHAYIQIKSKRIVATSQQIQKLMEKPSQSAIEQANLLMREVMKADNSGGERFVVDGSVMQFEKRIPLSLGLGEGLDKTLNGGIAQGELMLIVAGTGVGKTTIGMKIAAQMMRQHKKVMFVYFEDSLASMIGKTMSGLTGLSQTDCMAKDNPKAYKSKVEKYRKEGGEWILEKMNPKKRTVDDLINIYNSICATHGKPDVLIVDYLTKFTTNTRHKEKYHISEEVMGELEIFASQTKTRVIVMHQTNRLGMNTEVVNYDAFSGGFEVAQKAHITLTIARPMELKRNNQANAALLKSRVGEDGIVWNNIPFDNSNMTIEIPIQDTLSLKELTSAKPISQEYNY